MCKEMPLFFFWYIWQHTFLMNVSLTKVKAAFMSPLECEINIPSSNFGLKKLNLLNLFFHHKYVKVDTIF